jgi:hypothetical protein
MTTGPTLGDVVEYVGPGLLDVLAAPGGLDVAVGEAVIYDPTEKWTGGPDDIVLAVGVDPGTAGELLRAAARSGAAAVVVKAKDADAAATAMEAARSESVALLAATPDVAWGQLHALVRTAAAAAGAVPDAGGGGVPIGDLFALANAVAAMAGGPVTIEDPRSVVLAYSNLDDDSEIDEGRRATILGRRVPDEWIERLQADGVFRRLAQESSVVRADYAELGIRPRLAVAVRAGDEILGSIWVQEGVRPLGPETETALLEAARIAALHLLRHRSSADLERSRRADLLRAALEGRVAPETLAPVLQLGPTTELTVVAFELVDPGDVAAIAMLAERTVSLITLYCESYRRQAAAVALGPVIYLLVPHADAGDRERLPALATAIVERAAEALNVHLRAGVGGTVETLAQLLASRDEADRVLRALATAPAAPPVATVDAVRSRVVLHRLQELAAADPGLRRGKLEVLLEHDRDKGTEYMPTLRAYFAALGDVPSAAAAQGVHANTFRYRLRRLAEVAELDLDDPVERLVVQLQLYFSGA